jgi:RNA polymerase-binding transcription factor DksA
MPRREKINLEKVKASLFTVCTECGHKIQSGEYRRVDG